jgi:hypothetical protein
VQGSFEDENEPLDSTKSWEILDSLSDWWLFKEGFAP